LFRRVAGHATPPLVRYRTKNAMGQGTRKQKCREAFDQHGAEAALTLGTALGERLRNTYSSAGK
jgi:hypothetical protein